MHIYRVFLLGDYRFLRLEVLQTRWNHEILLYCSYLSLVFRLFERKPKRGIVANQWTSKDLKKKLGRCGGGLYIQSICSSTDYCEHNCLWLRSDGSEGGIPVRIWQHFLMKLLCRLSD